MGKKPRLALLERKNYWENEDYRVGMFIRNTVKQTEDFYRKRLSVVNGVPILRLTKRAVENIPLNIMPYAYLADAWWYLTLEGIDPITIRRTIEYYVANPYLRRRKKHGETKKERSGKKN